MYDVVKNVKRPDAALLKKIAKIQTATYHEAMGKRGALSHTIKPIWPESVVCGSALTVKARAGDNLMLHKAVSLAQPGDVLVVENDGFLEGGMWGEIITVAAMQKGIVGLITNGAVRDTVPIKKLGFPVFCAAVSIKGTTKAAPGTINNPIWFDGVVINPGDVVLGDNDGVVVIPREEAAQVYAAAVAKEEAEAEIMKKVRKGESTLDLLSMHEAYSRLGLKEES